MVDLAGRRLSPHKVLHWETGNRKIPQVEDFLANLAEDIAETQNLADDHPAIVRRLTRLHQKWTQEVSTQQGSTGATAGEHEHPQFGVPPSGG